jgi:coproporphyrinogen III oxidase-like Fe-S oxidoreductase
VPFDPILRFVDKMVDRVNSSVSFKKVTKLEDVLPEKIDRTSLNIRVPFCASRCTYCALPGQAYDEKMAHLFLAGLNEELKLYASYLGRSRVERVYISGGTPSLLHKEMEALLSIVSDHFELHGDVAMEASPADLSEEVLDDIKRAGVNQLSVGVQTFDEDILSKYLGRPMRKVDLVSALERVMARDFDYVNIDLMFSLPNQTKQMILDDIELASNIGVEGISTFPLMLLEYTPMTKKMEKEGMAIDDGSVQRDEEKERYLAIVRSMREHQYKLRTLWSFSTAPEKYEGPYEHSNFIGIGPKAWGMVNNRVTLNSPSVVYYIQMLEEGFLPLYAYSELSDYPLARAARRLYYGKIKETELSALMKEDGSLRKYVVLMKASGLLKKEGEYIVLTDKALAYGNHATKRIAMATLTSMNAMFHQATRGSSGPMVVSQEPIVGLEIE